MAKKASFESVLTLKAIDKVSEVVARISKMTSRDLNNLSKKADNLSKKSFNFAKGAAIGGAMLAAPIGYAVNEAVKFEDKMGDVAKVMNLDFGSAGFAKVSEEVKDLSVYLAQTPEDVAELYANIAQGGAAADQVGEISRLAGEIGVAYGISAGLAGESFIKLSNSMGLTVAETKKVTDAINTLGNNTASTSAQLLEFMSAGGAGAARNLGLAGQEAAAFGSVLIANGKSAAEAGTIFERTMKGILSNEAMRADFERNGGGLSGMLALFEKASKMGNAEQFKFFSSFGQYGTDISLLSKNFGQLQKTLGVVDNEQKFLNSSQEEFLNRQKTTATQLKEFKTSLTVLAISAGEVLLPALIDVVKALSEMMAPVTDFIKNNPKFVKFVMITGAVLAGLMFTASGVAGVIGTFATIFSGAASAMAWFKSANIAATASQWALNVAGYANPYVLIAAAIIVLIVVIALIIVYYDELSAAISNAWREGDTLTRVMMVIGAVMAGPLVPIFLLIGAINWLIDNWSNLGATMSSVWDLIKTVIMTGINSLINTLFSAGGNIITSLISGITSALPNLVAKVSSVAERIRGFFPFSPAKEGALSDIHKVKLIETVAETITPDPIIGKLNNVGRAAMGAMPQIVGAPDGYGATGGGSGIVVNFAPVINVQGGADNGTVDKINEAMVTAREQIERIIKDIMDDRQRLAY
jgi:TP901 family phage tail tape measure protein